MLSPATAAREPLHTRTVECRGFRREDGLWDVEGHMTDVKSYAFDNYYRGRIEPGEPLHDMWLRLTFDDNLVIHAIEAVTDRAPYEICPAITPAFQKLVGERIGAGFTLRVRQLLGGTAGCTHLVELLGPIATTAFQTIAPLRKAKPPSVPPRRPVLLNTCHAFVSDGEVAKRLWPDFYVGGDRTDD
ncbi:MAG TPA: DUF2889 domain-containing protein [Stellaceae bacterium]|nr:DUF2889 domain-containing protein [Stellaceae bacterium]